MKKDLFQAPFINTSKNFIFILIKNKPLQCCYRSNLKKQALAVHTTLKLKFQIQSYLISEVHLPDPLNKLDCLDNLYMLT